MRLCRVLSCRRPFRPPLLPAGTGVAGRGAPGGGARAPPAACPGGGHRAQPGRSRAPRQLSGPRRSLSAHPRQTQPRPASAVDAPWGRHSGRAQRPGPAQRRRQSRRRRRARKQSRSRRLQRPARRGSPRHVFPPGRRSRRGRPSASASGAAARSRRQVREARVSRTCVSFTPPGHPAICKSPSCQDRPGQAFARQVAHSMFRITSARRDKRGGPRACPGHEPRPSLAMPPKPASRTPTCPPWSSWSPSPSGDCPW